MGVQLGLREEKEGFLVRGRALAIALGDGAASVAVYQCVKLGELWHLTQEQASPPPVLRMGAYTSCSKWAEFRAGFEKTRPTCPECMKHMMVWEKRQKGTAFDWIAEADEDEE